MNAPSHASTIQPMLRTITPIELGNQQRPEPVDARTLSEASVIVEDVRERGLAAVRAHGERLGDIKPGEPLVLEIADLKRALDTIDRAARKTLDNAAERIMRFALAQRACLSELSMSVPGGSAGHWIAPMQRAGCYAPGGRFPLPSSVLMTACTARAAGVSEVWAASPRPAPITLAAAAIAGVDALLCVGGAQAIAALAFGAQGSGASGTPERSVLPCDIIVGPGNRYVTAAKKLVAGTVAIDMLAGPSEVLIIADDTAEAGVVAADLLAQAEHDTDARAILVSTSAELIARVNSELERQLADLPTSATARAAIQASYAVLCANVEEAVLVSDRHAPEHLEIQTRDARSVARRCAHFGAVFIGAQSAEVFGDYGLGPNHVLPTGGTSRSSAGLSVLNFLRVRTFLELSSTTDMPGIASEVAAFARLEGLEGHARASERRARG